MTSAHYGGSPQKQNMSGWFHKPFGHRKKKGAEGDKRPAVTIKLRKNGGDVVNVTIKVRL